MSYHNFYNKLKNVNKPQIMRDDVRFHKVKSYDLQNQMFQFLNEFFATN